MDDVGVKPRVMLSFCSAFFTNAQGLYFLINAMLCIAVVERSAICSSATQCRASLSWRGGDGCGVIVHLCVQGVDMQSVTPLVTL